jgi:hypothetical protein
LDAWPPREPPRIEPVKFAVVLGLALVLGALTLAVFFYIGYLSLK